MLSKHCLKDDLDSELPSYHGYWTLIILDMAFAWLCASPFLVLSITSMHNLCTLQWLGQSSTKITCKLHSCSQFLSAYDCTNDKCFCFFTCFSKNVFVRINGTQFYSSGAMNLMNPMPDSLCKSPLQYPSSQLWLDKVPAHKDAWHWCSTVLFLVFSVRIYQVALTAQLPLYTAVATISAKISLLLW